MSALPEGVARAGLLAYGVVHVVIGWLAVQLAFGERSGQASSSGAIQELAQQPFGIVLVWAVALGMFLLALWQGAEAAKGHDDEDGHKRTAKRVASAGKAVVYVAIGVSAVRKAVGSSSKGGTDSTTATLMNLPAGQLLVGAVGLTIAGVGVFFAARSFTEGYMKKIGATGKEGRAYKWLGKAGYAAKGVAFVIVGGLFVYAAATHEAKKSGGLDQALKEVLDQPLGPLLLALIGAGFGAYGLFCFAWSRHKAADG